MFTLEDVDKRFGEGEQSVWALRGVSLEIPAGQLVSVMGPSGSGKSTLLNLMAALDAPTGGRIVFDGNDLKEMDDDRLTLLRRRRIGLVFQFFNLLPSLTAVENVLFPRTLDGRPQAEDRERARSLLDSVGLASKEHRRPSELSGGEMQRVAVARAMMCSPSAVLADEPTGNLDSRAGRAVLDVLKRFQSETGCTVVMVTHDRGAAEIGDRLVSLRDGAIEGDEALGKA